MEKENFWVTKTQIDLNLPLNESNFAFSHNLRSQYYQSRTDAQKMKYKTFKYTTKSHIICKILLIRRLPRS
jgi:hypothetical protein